MNVQFCWGRGLICPLMYLFVISSNLYASEMVYVPNNPSFGGSPSNAPGLLAVASSTNKHTEGSKSATSLQLNQSPLAQFNQTLERNVVNQLASAATSKIIGRDGKLTPGTLSTGNFTISIIDSGGGTLQVTTTDKVTGAITSFVVQQ